MTDENANTRLTERLPLTMRLQGFRAFKDSRWLKLAPLTCLVGRNSSGKSSIMSAILVLKQSLEQGTMSSAVMPLTLSGPYCDLGNYKDVVHGHVESREIIISFGVPLEKLRAVERGVRTAAVELGLPRPSRQGIFYAYSRRPEDTKGTVGYIEARMIFGVDEPFGPSLTKLQIKVKGIASITFVRTKGRRRQHWRTYTNSLPSRSVGVLSTSRWFFPPVRIRDTAYKKSTASDRKKIRETVEAVELLFRFLSRTLSDSELIGPFRTPPERRYAFGGFSASRKTPSGEHAMDLLITEALLRRKEVSRPLHAALSFWIKHLRLAKSLNIKDVARRANLFELDVRGAGGGARANVADVGFGVSQVLPVLVQGLLTKPGGMYLVQQPEIHLHPDAQAGLADFFIFLATTGVITIVETHSEYLLLRIRRRLAEGGAPQGAAPRRDLAPLEPLRKKDVSILCAEPGPTGSTKVTELLIGDSFQFENLPKGFMSQALEDRMALLSVIARQNA